MRRWIRRHGPYDVADWAVILTVPTVLLTLLLR